MFLEVKADGMRMVLALEKILRFNLQVLGDVVKVTLLLMRCDIVILRTAVAYPSLCKLPHISTR
jgi:hypothetical protein